MSSILSAPSGALIYLLRPRVGKYPAPDGCLVWLSIDRFVPYVNSERSDRRSPVGRAMRRAGDAFIPTTAELFSTTTDLKFETPAW
jgi:hypothetical protein